MFAIRHEDGTNRAMDSNFRILLSPFRHDGLWSERDGKGLLSMNFYVPYGKGEGKVTSSKEEKSGVGAAGMMNNVPVTLAWKRYVDEFPKSRYG